MKLCITLEVGKGDTISGADLQQLIDHVRAVRDLAHGGHLRPQPETTRPETTAPARTEPDRGDAWEPPFDEFEGQPASRVSTPSLSPEPTGRGRRRPARSQPEDLGQDEDPDDDTPRDGRQLMGWARKQVPDAIGPLMSYGKTHGLPSKIVTWDAEQVRAAYHHARDTRPSTGR
jgi:hypothetical protein